MEPIEVSVDFGGRTLTLQTGKLAKQSDASVLGRYGDTMVLVTVVASKDLKEGQDFFPLTVDFQEKYYAAGRVPGGFFKREAKASDRATLSARMIDRPCRPLFPEDFLCETNVVATVLSVDGENEPEIVASIAASAALHISDIPWAGPIGTCRVGKIDGQWIANPTPEQQETSSLELLVSGVRTGLIMVEGSAQEVSEQEMVDALDFAHKSMLPVMDMIEDLRKKTGNKEKREYKKPPSDADLKKDMRKLLWTGFEKAFSVREKLARYESLKQLKEMAKQKFTIAEPKDDGEKARNKLIGAYYEELKSVFARELTLDSKKRIDGRGYAEIRKITSEVGLLPRVHGSGLFTRGETQVLSTVTLGTADDEQKIDSIHGVYQKTFLLHYNFPPFSVGEARPLRPPGRREIGHGFLAERALSFVIPPKDVFPYTVRIVSEVLESNGSSSMATVCSGSLALMDAGVPVPKPVAGVAMGLIKEGDKVAVISDILGDEDHLGDMDFKVCGTAEGITAFQMDLKIGGVSREIMEQALDQAKQGRLHILEEMAKTMSAPRDHFSQYAPRIFTMKVKPDKVREVIGSGGKVIRSIIERTGVKIDIEDDGTINIASADNESAQKAIEIINQIVEEPEVGRIYEGKVTRIAEFGAFIEIIPGTDGLCHISELADYRVRRTEDVVKEGDIVRVKCLDVDSMGKIRLSRKALLKEEAEQKAAGGEGGAEAAPTAGGEAGAPAPEVRGMAEERGGEREARPERSERPERGGREERGGGRDREDRGPRGDRGPRERDAGGEGRGMRDDRPDRGGDRAPRDRGGRDRDDRPRDDRPRDDRPRGDRDRGPSEDRGPRGDRDREPRDSRPSRDREERPRDDRPRDDRPSRDDRPRDDRPPRDDRGGRGESRFGRDRGDRGGNDRGGDRDRGGRGGSDRGGRGYEDRDRGSRGGSSERPERAERTFDRSGREERGPSERPSDRGGRGGRDEGRSFDRDRPDDDRGNRAPRDDRGGSDRGGRGPRGGGRGGSGGDRGGRMDRDDSRGNRRDSRGGTGGGADRTSPRDFRERDDRGIHFDPEDGLMRPQRFQEDED